MMTQKQSIFTIVAIIIGTYSCSAVASSSAHENTVAPTTLQSDIKKAKSGDTILVPAGRHTINTINTSAGTSAPASAHSHPHPVSVTLQNNVTLLFQPGTELHFTNDSDSGKIYTLSGFGASKSETLKIPPSGVTVQIQNPDYRHGAMVTVRNKSQNNAVIVEWHGSADRNNSYCTNHKVELSGPTAQASCFVPPQPETGRPAIFIRSATQKTCPVEIEIFNWANGPGCR